jgi:hypothetical protein
VAPVVYREDINRTKQNPRVLQHHRNHKCPTLAFLSKNARVWRKTVHLTYKPNIHSTKIWLFKCPLHPLEKVQHWEESNFLFDFIFRCFRFRAKLRRLSDLRHSLKHEYWQNLKRVRIVLATNYKGSEIPCLARQYKAKLYRYRPEQTLGRSGRLRPRIFLTFGRQPYAPAGFTPRHFPGTHI